MDQEGSWAFAENLLVRYVVVVLLVVMVLVATASGRGRTQHGDAAVATSIA